MQLFSMLFLLFTLAAAHPSPYPQDLNATETNATSEAAANCQPGLTYCYAQIVDDLRMSELSVFITLALVIDPNQTPFSSLLI